MSDQRAHQVTTDDGVTIRATVEGHGPPVVFLQGVIGDGDHDWRAMVTHLSDRFTCHLPSMRGRGGSDAHTNLRLDRISTDYATYVESLGEAARLVGWSAGAGHGLALSARLEAVVATAAYEPVVGMVMDEQERADLRAALAQGHALALRDDLTGSIRAIAAHPFTPADLAAADQAGYFDATSGYASHVVEVFHQLPTYDGPMPEDPEILGAIPTPVLVLRGSETSPVFVRSADHVLAHTRRAQLSIISGAGHAGPLTHPRSIAQELLRFFDDPQTGPG